MQRIEYAARTATSQQDLFGQRKLVGDQPISSAKCIDYELSEARQIRRAVSTSRGHESTVRLLEREVSRRLDECSCRGFLSAPSVLYFARSAKEKDLRECGLGSQDRRRKLRELREWWLCQLGHEESCATRIIE